MILTDCYFFFEKVSVLALGGEDTGNDEDVGWLLCSIGKILSLPRLKMLANSCRAWKSCLIIKHEKERIMERYETQLRGEDKLIL